MNSVTAPPTIEEHAGISVVREDLYDPELPSGKLRGVIPFFAELKDFGYMRVINYAVSYSNSHAIVAFAARKVGLKALSITNCTYSTPQTKLAEEYGAEMEYVGPRQLGPLTALVKRRYSQIEKPDYLLPWGLAHSRISWFFSELSYSIDEEFDAHVVPMGAGGYVYGVSQGLIRRWGFGRTSIFAIPSTGTVERNYQRLMGFEYDGFCPIKIVQRPLEPGIPPFPFDPHYEGWAWPYAIALKEKGLRVAFWNIGRPLC